MLFKDNEFFAELILKQTGPTFIFIKTVAVIRAVGRIRAVTVCIGIAETDNVFSHVTPHKVDSDSFISYFRGLGGRRQDVGCRW